MSIHVYPHVATCQYVQYLWNSFLPYCTFVFMQTIDVVYYTHVYKLSVYISCV